MAPFLLEGWVKCFFWTRTLNLFVLLSCNALQDYQRRWHSAVLFSLVLWTDLLFMDLTCPFYSDFHCLHNCKDQAQCIFGQLEKKTETMTLWRYLNNFVRMHCMPVCLYLFDYYSRFQDVVTHPSSLTHWEDHLSKSKFLKMGIKQIEQFSEATQWLSWRGVGLASANRLPMAVRILAGPLESLKVQPAERQRAPTKKKSNSLATSGPWRKLLSLLTFRPGGKKWNCHALPLFALKRAISRLFSLSSRRDRKRTCRIHALECVAIRFWVARFFRWVALETFEWTSRDSNHYQQSVSTGKNNAKTNWAIGSP